MKISNIFKSITLSVALIASAACEQQIDGGDQNSGDVTPVFPELIENYAVEPGSTHKVVFTPNLDWKISIPSEMRKWFWIQDGSFEVVELEGYASKEPVEVLIGVTETAEFDKNFSCDVTLEMGDSAKVIAKYMLPAKEKTMQIYVAKLLSESEFELDQDGVSYVYAEEVATDFNLIWSTSDSDFRLPIKVVSNCEWKVELPEWAEVNVPETTTGIVELVITGESIEGASGSVVFSNGETQLASIDITIPSCKEILVYSAQFSDGEFEYSEDGEYLWTENTVSKATLAWLGSDFRVPVKVDSKCNWVIETPDWLSVEIPEKTAGVVSLTLMGVPSKYPLEDASGLIKFKNGDVVLYEFEVTIPGCKDILAFNLDMSLTELEFNYLGSLKTSTGYVEGAASGHLTSSKAARIFAVETTGNRILSENPDWLKIEVSNWNTADGASVLQERSVSVSVSENKGAVRSAVLFVLPPSITAKVSEMLTENGSVKEAYADYATPVIQASNVYDEYIVMNFPEAPTYTYTFEAAAADKKENLISIFGKTDYVYVLNYESPYCSDEAYMTMAIEFSTYKIFDSTDTSLDMSADESFWLKYRNSGDSNAYGVMDMYQNMDLPTRQSVGYVVFYGSDNGVLAIVECVSPFEPETLELDETSLMFASEAAENKINITSNVAWTAESNAEWCKVSPDEGLKNGSVKISVTENDTDQARTAQVTIKSEGITRVVKVEQGFGEVLEVSLSEMEFNCLSSSDKFNVTANVSWTIESSADWCTVNSNSGNRDAQVTVSVTRNITDAARTAVLTIKSDKITRTIAITQNYDDGSITNGDADVHFVDWNEAKQAGAVLERLTSGDIYKKYKDGSIPVYHLTYTQTDKPLRIVLPKDIVSHNVNPYSSRNDILVNGVAYDDESLESPGIIKLDADNSVQISMTLPSGKDFLRGNINFTEKSSDAPVIILVCTIDVSGK